MPHPLARRLRRASRGDDGISLIEVMVALFVFALMSLGVLALLVSAIDTVHANEGRTVAANIAQRQIETARGTAASAIPDGLTESSVEVDGTTYTVRQTATYSSSTYGGECGGEVAHKQVSVEVSWPGMGAVEPVRSDTVKTVTIGEFDLSAGVVAVPVVDRQDQPLSGAHVTLGALSQTTGGNGCAVFVGVPPGAVAVTATRANHVDPQGSDSPSRDVLVQAGRTVTAPPVRLDAAAGLRLTPVAVPGTALPLTLGVTVANTSLATGAVGLLDCSQVPSGTRCVTGPVKEVTGLFPFVDGYEVWAGTCTEARPQPAPASTGTAPGSVVDVSLPLGRLDVQVVRPDATGTLLPVAGVTVRATAQCDVQHALGTSSATGQLSVSLPRGTWLVEPDVTACVEPTGGWTWPSATVTPGGAAAAVQVQLPATCTPEAA